MSISIRSWKKEDANILADMLNNKNVLDNLNDGIPFPYTLSDANDFIAGLNDLEPNNAFIWAITENGVVVGGISVFRRENVRRLTAELGYYLDEKHWGKGIMVQAIHQACKYIFKNTDIVRIFAEPFCTNQASLGITGRIAIYVSENNSSISEITGGLLINLALFFVPGFLFITSLILAARLIRRKH